MKFALIILTVFMSCLGSAQDGKPRVIEKREEITNDKEVIVDKQMQRDITVTRTKTNPVVIMLFDFSGSMASNNALENNKLKVKALVEQNEQNPHWQAGIIPFAGCYASDDDLLKLSIPAGTGKGRAIWNSVKDRQPVGNTDYVRALRVGLRMLNDNDYADLILFTDYEDSCGGQVGQLIAQLQARETQVQQKENYTVQEKHRVQEKHVRIHVMTDAAGESKLALKKLAKETGGKYLDSDEKQIKFLEDLVSRQEKTEIHILKENETEAEVVTAREQEQEMEVQEKKKQPERAVQKAKAQEKKGKQN